MLLRSLYNSVHRVLLAASTGWAKVVSINRPLVSINRPFYIFIINITDWIKLIISSQYIQSVDIHLYKSIIMWRWRNCKLYKSPSPPHLPPISLFLAQCYEKKKNSSTHFVQMVNWISHNEKCIANYFSVWVLVFLLLVNSSSPWLVTHKIKCRSRKILPYIT